jgi:hypothetical protein
MEFVPLNGGGECGYTPEDLFELRIEIGHRPVDLVRLDLVGLSRFPYLATEISKGSVSCLSLFLEETTYTPGGESILFLQESGTNGHSKRLPWGVCFVWLGGGGVVRVGVS